jgi:two-component system, response regulator YesN
MASRKREVIFRYITNYFLVLMIPLISVVVVYFWTVNIVEANTLESSQSVLQHNVEIMENSMAGISSLVNQIGLNPAINTFFRSDSPFMDKTTVADIIKAQQTLNSYSITNNFVDNIQVYSNKSKIVIDQTTSFIRPNFLYELGFSYEGLTYTDWMEGVLQRIHQKEVWPAANMTQNNAKGRYILYLQSIPIGGSGTPVGNILVFINEKKYASLFESIGFTEGGWYCIKDAKGQVISGSPGFDGIYPQAFETAFKGQKGYVIDDVDGVRMFITFTHGIKVPWLYVVAVPYQDVMKATSGLKYLLGALVAITVTLGILIAIYMAYKAGKPMGHLLAVLSGSASGPVKFDNAYLETAVLRILKNNESLSRELENTIPAQKTALIHRLLSGEFKDASQLHADFLRFGIDIRGNYHIVLIVQINDIDTGSPLEELSAYKVLLNDAFSRNIPGLIGTYDIDIDRIALVASSNADNRSDLVATIEAQARTIYEEMLVRHQINLSFAGHIVDEITSVPLDFHRTLQVLVSEKARSSDKVHWYKKTAVIQEMGYFYPIDLEMNLITAVVNGNAITAQNILMSLYKRNVATPDTARDVQVQFLGSLKTTLNRITEKLPDMDATLFGNISQMSVVMDDGRKLKDAFAEFQAMILQLCTLSQKNSDENSKGIKRGIIAFIHEHYADAQLSLSLVADKFSISEVYLSRMFKEYTGENFSKYIEALRLKEAQRLIEARKVPIYQISKLVGYNSPQVFRRAYQKYFGKSPSD